METQKNKNRTKFHTIGNKSGRKRKKSDEKATKGSHLENKFYELWIEKYPNLKLERERKMFKNTKHRADFAHAPSKVYIEIQGAIWAEKSGHNSGTGLIRDYKKICLANSVGWLVFPLAEKMFTNQYLDLVAKTIIKRMTEFQTR